MIPVSGEQHERAVEAAIHGHASYSSNIGIRRAIDAYHRSLREQGVRLIAQPECADCKGSGDTVGRANGGGATDGEFTYERPCPRCNGTGYVRLVDLRAVVEYVREWQDDWNEGAMVPPPADAIERRFGP